MAKTPEPTVLSATLPLQQSKMDDDAESTASSGSSSELSNSDPKNARGYWIGKLDFILSCIGYAVGLGNIWRFPYLCYNNGGGAFLIPYCIFAILCGMPLFMLELNFGQFTSLSPIRIWKISPLFKGLGYGMVIISGIVCIYYNIIITWTLYYLFESFRTALPWATCDNPWNTPNCVTSMGSGVYDTANATVNATANITSDVAVNMSMVNATHKATGSQEFWIYEVLQLSSGLSEMGDVQWKLFGCLVLAWIIVFLCLCKGVKTSGRVVYFSATFPYIVLVILLVRGLTLPGANIGISFYLSPKWEKLLEFEVWGAAATQIFYSMGAAWGGLITMASYNKFHNNCYRDALIVPLANCGTSLFAGLVVFSVVGYMSHETGLPIDKVVNQGAGLAFVVYPEAVAKFPISPLWSCLFFLMLFTVGIDSQFGMFETMVSAFVDEFPEVLRPRKLAFTAAMAGLLFVLGIPCVMQGGMYVLTLMDWYSASFSLMLIAMTECLVVSWVYGGRRFMADMEMMLRFRPSRYWQFMWSFVTPLVIFCLLVFTMVNHTPAKYDDVEYPWWGILIGWFMALASIAPLPIIATLEIMKHEGTFLQRVRAAWSPAPDWGPAREEHRVQYKEMLRSHGVQLSPAEQLPVQFSALHNV